MSGCIRRVIVRVFGGLIFLSRSVPFGIHRPCPAPRPVVSSPATPEKVYKRVHERVCEMASGAFEGWVEGE